VHSKTKLSPLATLAWAFFSGQANGQASQGPDPNVQSSLVGSTLTCSPTSATASAIRVPLPLVDRAKLKARLANLLRDSLFDDAKGIVNIAREKEIKKLASKLGREREE
jgi:hypothetical protein